MREDWEQGHVHSSANSLRVKQGSRIITMASTGDLTEKGKESFEGLVTCPICMNPLISPKTLICDHSFCKQCLADIIGARLTGKDVLRPGELWIDCPTCRKRHCGLKSISDLRTNHIVTQMLDFYYKNTEQPAGLQRGQCCCKDIAKFACLRCQTKYCKTCINNITETNCLMANNQKDDSVKSKHFIVGIIDNVDINDAHGSDIYHCKEHYLSLDYYCTLCKDPICLDCFITKHYSHITKTIKAAKKDAMDVCYHLKSVHTENKASRKAIGEETQKVIEKNANMVRGVLEMLQNQQLKMQRFMTCLFDQSKVSCRKGLAKRIDMFLKEATKINTSNPRIDSLASLIDNPEGNDLQIVSNISNLYAALMLCQQEADEIEETLQFVKERQYFHRNISPRINHGKIFQSMVELFSNITFDPPSAGKLFPIGITLEKYGMDDAQYRNITTDATVHSKGSPINIYVDDPSGGAKACKAFGPGLDKAVAGEPCKVTVKIRGAGSGQLGVAVEGPAKADFQCHDNGDGTCDITWYPVKPGEYALQIRLAEEPIPGSPFMVHVMAPGDDAAMSKAKFQEAACTVGQQASLTVRMKDQDVQLTASVVSPSGTELDCSVVEIKKKSFAIEFVPKKLGEHRVNVFLDCHHVSECPCNFEVRGFRDPSKVRAYGPGLRSGVVNVESEFTVNALEAGSGALALSIDGPAEVKLNCVEQDDGTYKVTYRPTIPGSYEISIRFDEQQILGKAYEVLITAS